MTDQTTTGESRGATAEGGGRPQPNPWATQDHAAYVDVGAIQSVLQVNTELEHLEGIRGYEEI